MATRHPKTPTPVTWSHAHPLLVQRILVSRAREQASALSQRLRNAGAEVLEIPFIVIREPESFAQLDEALRRTGDYDWLILTSVNGVRALFRRSHEIAVEPSSLAHLKIAAIGPATKAAIERHGLKVDVMPEEYVAESVVRSLRAKVKGQRVLLVRAKVARDVIPQQLRDAGAEVAVIEAYETVVPRASAHKLQSTLQDREHPVNVITFTSSSTANNFVSLLGHKPGALDAVKLASIGPVTSATLRQLGLTVDIEAREYTMAGLVDAIVEAVGR